MTVAVLKFEFVILLLSFWLVFVALLESIIQKSLDKSTTLYELIQIVHKRQKDKAVRSY